MKRPRVGRGDEGGSALVLALVFITVVSLLISVTLTFAAISVRYGDELTTGRRSLYTADGLIEAAISQVANGSACGGDFVLPDLNGIDADDATVECDPSSVDVTPLTRPEQAILTLGRDEGEDVTQLSGGPMSVAGDVFSNEDVSSVAPPTAIVATGTITAVDTCTGGPTTPACTSPASSTATPDYRPILPSLPDGTISDCTGDVVELTPGIYDDASLLNPLTTVGSLGDTCDGKVIHLNPGVGSGPDTYYFDFTNVGSNTWTINDPDVRIVGGTATGVLGPSTPVPGSCDTTKRGVQLVFGGVSRVDLVLGGVELCPTPSGSGQQLSIVGLDQTPPAVATPNAAANIAGFDHPSNVPDNALVLEGASSTSFASADLAPGESATMTVSGFAAPFLDDFELSDVKMLISHRESSVVSPRATVVTSDDVEIATETISTCSGGTSFCQDIVALAGSPTPEQIAGASVRYSADASSAGFAYVDGIELLLSYSPPARKLDGCHEATYSPMDGSTCALLKASGGKLIVHGTVYAPTADLDVSVVGTDQPVFGRGVIAESLRFGITAAQTEPAIGLPQTSRPALLALGVGGNGGITQRSDSGALAIRGDVVSRAPVVANDADGLAVQGAVRTSGCTGDITATEGKTCTVTDLGSVDPGYETPLSDQGAVVRQADCPATGWLKSLLPGLYRSASDLSVLTDGTCVNIKVVHFEPGVYYFNFDFDGPCAGAAADAACTWTVDEREVKVVGGEPLGWSSTDPDSDNVGFPGACSTDAEGVTFVFGGESRIDVQDGRVELCAGAPSDREPVALFGASDAAQTRVVTPTASGAFQPLLSAKGIDGVEAAATVTDTATPAVAAFDAGITVPPGSRIDSAKLTIAHREPDPSFDLSLTTTTPGVTFSPSPALAVCTSPTPCSTSPALDVIGLTEENLDSFTFNYEADRTGSVPLDTFLDGAKLAVTYTSPGADGLSGCQLGGATACPLLMAGNDARIAVQGIVYAPKGAVDVDLKKVSTPIFGREVIARKITIGATPVAGYSGLVATAPSEMGSLGVPPGHVLTASINGKTGFRARLRARVEFGLPVGGRRPATIRSWAVLP